MSSYYPSFNYKGLNSLKDKNLIVAAFNADDGEMDTFLGMDSIYTDKYDGTRRIDYGAKFNSVAVIKISVIKANRNDFTVSEVRDFLKWTTGSRQNSYLDLVIDNKVHFSFLGRVTNVYQQKLDARTIGLSIEFTSVSPWAYSPVQRFVCDFGQALSHDDGIVYGNYNALHVNDSGDLYSDGILRITNDGVLLVDNTAALSVNNATDDLYTYTWLDVIFRNDNSDYVSIKNLTSGEETIIQDMGVNEVITISSDQFIISDVPNKIFGNTFNFVWPRLIPGVNEFAIEGSGSGSLEFSYRYPIKIGDCAISIYTSDSGYGYADNTTYGAIYWNDIIDPPTTLSGYGITDAYTDVEVDEKIKNVDMTINQKDLSEMLKDVLI